MQEFRVELDAYSGPLDLLLYLVRRHEVDLNDIPIAELTAAYLRHLELIRQIDIDVAGEFLVMATTLLEIKSAMLLPRPEARADGEDGEGDADEASFDPRYELVQQLLAYKQYKDAAESLHQQQQAWERRFAHRPAKLPHEVRDDDAPPDIDLEDVSVLDLCEAFTRLMETVGPTPGKHAVKYDDTPIAIHTERILERLTKGGATTLAAMFSQARDRTEMIGMFLATLELVRQRKLAVKQDGDGEISLEATPQGETPPDNDKARDWTNPETGQIDYDWPDPEFRKRAQRRAHLRAAYAARKNAGGAPAHGDADGLDALDDPVDRDDTEPDADDAE